MNKAIVTFFGKKVGQHGMPTPYHSYFVLSFGWDTEETGVASVIALSPDAPAPNPPHKLTRSGGKQRAFEKMLGVLRNLPENKDLMEKIEIDKECGEQNEIASLPG